MNRRSVWTVILALAAVKVAIHLWNGPGWGFQRDALLYLAQGRHLAWGYWSTPPFIGAIAGALQAVSGAGPGVVHFVSMIPSTATLVLAGVMAKDLGGGRWAAGLAGLGVLVSPGFLRSGALFQPVVFDVFFWTMGSWIVLRYVKTGHDRWLYALGALVGVATLNKYSMAFFVLGLAIAALLTRHRRVFLKPALWGAIGIATLIVLPNLVWQYQHRFPVVTHMRELSISQLGNVTSAGFLLDQLLTYSPVALVWIAGLVWLMSRSGRDFRILGWFYLAIIALMLGLSGKSYYTMGLYPMLLAAGGVALERIPVWGRSAIAVVAVVLGGLLAPFSLPILSPGAMAEFSADAVRDMGTDAPLRWEDGEVYPLPQDYADMLGWPEIAAIVERAVAEGGDPEGTLIYAENYGQAGAIEFYAGLEVLSFSDAYRIWAPDQVPPEFSTLVYVNHELGDDIEPMYESVRLVGSLDMPLAREHGVSVWLCQGPVPELPGYYRERVAGIKASFRRETGGR